MDCKYHSSDNYNDVDESNTKRGKARIADVALKTLLNLNTSMKEMKCWENERSIFKNKIINQNEKIRYLETNNDSLIYEVKNLKSSLATIEKTSGGKKFEEFFRDDKKIDALVVDSAGKIIRTIEDLSNELVNANYTINVFRNRNECLEIKSDKLRAMIRVFSGNNKDFGNRIDEFNNLVLRIDKETHMLKNSLENMDNDGNLKIYEERIKSIELLMRKFEIKLKNDQHAFFSGGNSYWSVYLKRIAKLESSSEGLLLQLETIKAELCSKSYGMESSHSAEYQKSINKLEELVKRVGSDLKSLKTEAMKIGSRIGVERCMEYSKRMKTLEKLVTTSKSIINKLIIESKESSEVKQATQYDQVLSRSKRNIVKLQVLVKKFKSSIKELEITVVSVDSTKLIEKIRKLENFVSRLKNEFSNKEEENNSLGLELIGAKIAFGEKVEALEKLQMKYEKIANKMKNRGHEIVNEDQQRIEILLRELEQTKIEAQNSKTIGDELNRLRLDVTNFGVERALLLEEINKDRTIIEDKENRILTISKEKEIIEETLTKNINETEVKLMIAVEEIKCLKKEIFELKEDIESTSNRCQSIANEATKVELNRLEVLLKDTAKSLESTSNEYANLKSKFNEVISEKAKIELELSRMKIQNEALIVHLNSEKVTTAETLKDCHKLMADFQLQESDLHSLKTERSTIIKNLEESEREKNALKVEIDELRQGNITLRDESLSLRSKVNQLSQDLEKSNCRKIEVDTRFKKLDDETRKQCIHINSLINENERLNDELDKTRSDKLDIAGTLNDWRLHYEETKNLLDSKIEEVKSLDEHLKDILKNNEELKIREVAMKLEVTKWLEENVELRRTIDVLNSDKARLEEQLKSLSNECQALKSQLKVSQSDNDALKNDTNALKRRADKLMEDLKKLTSEMEQSTQERVALDAEHRDTIERNKRKLEDFEIEHETLKIELIRLRAENTSLKSELDRISVENDKMRRGNGKKGEPNRLTVENESLKFELANLRNGNAKADRELELAKIEREKLCQEVRTLNTENCTLRMLLEKIKTANEITSKDSRIVKEHLNELKVENDELRKNIENAKNNIAIREDRTNGLEAERNILKSSIEELKEKQRVSRTETEEIKSRNENLTKEIRNLKKEDVALREEVNTLRSVIKKVNDDNSKMRTEFAHIEEEMEALKAELSRARAENSLLRTQFNAKRTESCKLESEKAALKEKLEELRHSKILDAENEKELRNEYEKLELHKVMLESKLMDALKEIGKYNVATSKLNGLEDKLKDVLKDYVITKKLLRSANEEVDQLRRFTNSYTKSSNYNENIEAS